MIYPIKIITVEELNIDTKDVLWYLGYGRNEADCKTLALIEECKEKLLKEVSFKACVSEVDISVNDTDIDIGFKVKSKDLSKNLKGLSKGVIFCATIGVGADRLILRYTKTEPSLAVIYDAVASAMIEAFCDYISSTVKGRPRFSCGFGDFTLDNQKYFIKALDTERKIGVTLSDGNIMIPTKTVTAVIGIEE